MYQTLMTFDYQGIDARRRFRHETDPRYSCRLGNSRHRWCVSLDNEYDFYHINASPACRTLENAKSLSAGVKNATPISLDVTHDSALDAEIAKHDLVISLIPYTFHAAVIKSAIRQKKHVVTTSYVSPAMLELDQAAKDAGITVMNEIGLGGCLIIT